LEGKIYDNKEEDEQKNIQITLLVIKEFLREEYDLEQIEKQFEKDEEERLTTPSEEETTNLGDIEHKGQKGSIPLSAMSPVGHGLLVFELRNKNKYIEKRKKDK
jgi:hypothetical protein